MKKRIVSALSAVLVEILFLSSCDLNTEPSSEDAVDYFESENNVATSIANNYTKKPVDPTESLSIEPTQEPETEITSTTLPATTTTITTIAVEPPAEYQELVVHFIDVGQGDSTFIELPTGETMLIDAGESEYGDKVVDYIYSQGYDTLDYVVATHPHSDHIGGMVDVFNSFSVENVYMTSFVTTTNTYENMLSTIEDNEAAVHEVMAGAVILDEPELRIEVVAPKEIGDNCNNNSVVLKLTFGENKFLFAGDAEKTEEDGIWTKIKCDVLKVGHHGSETSSSANFLKKAEPTYAVISCGLGNSYGHQDEAVLKRLNERNISVYRTDIQGNIVFHSDGTGITVNDAPAEYTYIPTASTTTFQVTEPEKEPTSVTYVMNTNTKKIHYSNCPSVDQMKDKNKAYTDDYAGAIAQGYVPCKNCNPTG